MSATPSPWAWGPARPSRLVESVSLMRLEGRDSLRVLHGQTSQAIEGARAGQLLSTCVIGPTARLRGLAEVLVDAGGAWLVVTAGEGALVHQALDRVLFPADQVTLGPVETATLVTPSGHRPPTPCPPLPRASGSFSSAMATEAGCWAHGCSGLGGPRLRTPGRPLVRSIPLSRSCGGCARASPPPPVN